MTIGVSPLYYPQDQPTPEFNLEIDNSYFRVRLHDTQVFFQANWWSQADLVTLTSSVESTFQPNSATQSLHKISTIEKNTPCHLGVATNLTDWLTARAGDSLRVNIKYTVLQGQPIEKLVTQMEKADLVAKLSLRPDWAVALKVTNIVGKLLSFLAEEGKQKDVFNLVIDLNVANLKTGYYVAIGSHSSEDWIQPQFMKIDAHGRLKNNSIESSFSRISYAAIQVLGIPRLRQEEFRDEPWWQLLETVKENIFDSEPSDERERRELIGEWRFALRQARDLARKRREFLWSEIKEILGAAEVEVNQKLKPQTTKEAFSDDELPGDLQDILELETEEELQEKVRDYQDALEVSQQLLAKYGEMLGG